MRLLRPHFLYVYVGKLYPNYIDCVSEGIALMLRLKINLYLAILAK